MVFKSQESLTTTYSLFLRDKILFNSHKIFTSSWFCLNLVPRYKLEICVAIVTTYFLVFSLITEMHIDDTRIIRVIESEHMSGDHSSGLSSIYQGADFILVGGRLIIITF